MWQAEQIQEANVMNDIAETAAAYDVPHLDTFLSQGPIFTHEYRDVANQPQPMTDINQLYMAGPTFFMEPGAASTGAASTTSTPPDMPGLEDYAIANAELALRPPALQAG